MFVTCTAGWRQFIMVRHSLTRCLSTPWSTPHSSGRRGKRRKCIFINIPPLDSPLSWSERLYTPDTDCRDTRGIATSQASFFPGTYSSHSSGRHSSGTGAAPVERPGGTARHCGSVTAMHCGSVTWHAPCRRLNRGKREKKNECAVLISSGYFHIGR